MEHAEGSDGTNKANRVEERMKRAIQEAEGEDQGSFVVSEPEANADHMPLSHRKRCTNLTSLMSYSRLRSVPKL